MPRSYRGTASQVAMTACLAALGTAGFATQAHAQNVCIPVLGGTTCNVTADTIASPLPAVAGALDVTVSTATDLVGSLTASATGLVTATADSNILSTADGVPALSLTSGDAIDATVQGLTTSGAGAAGALLRANTNAALQALGPVTTSGNGSDGINVLAGSVDIAADAVQTLGADADAVQLVSLNGPITLNADLLDTSGDRSNGALLNALGGIDLDVGVLRTAGGQALGLNLSTDPAVCAALAAGSCDINGVVGTLTTQGPGSIGALVNAAAATSLSIDALQTNGSDAAGIDLTTNPAACAVIGAGNCGTDFTVGNLLTLGDRSPGILATIVGPTTANVDLLETDGANSPGIAIVGDPAACVLLGSGACDTGLTVGNLLTTGDGSGGISVNVPAVISGDLGSIVTRGDDAPGVLLRADPQACATLGIGACGVDLNATNVSTGGANSPGIGVAAVGPISLDLGQVSTSGINSPAVGIATDPQACAVLGAGECTTNIAAGSITTGGNGSTGLGVLASGPLTVTTGPVSTLGTDADGILLVTDPTACLIAGVGACPTTATTGPVSTGGNGSTGIGVAAAGPVLLNTGNVSTLGTDAPGIIVATDPALCAVLGTGACSTTVNTGSVATSGDGSPGIGVLAGGPTTVSTGSITTGGAQSPGLTVITDPAACLAVGSALCTATVVTGPVTTTGPDSPGVTVGVTGPTTINTGPITTGGTGSDGLVVTIDPSACLALGRTDCVTQVITGPIDTGGGGGNPGGGNPGGGGTGPGGIVIGDTGGNGPGGGGGGSDTVTVIAGPINSGGNGIDVNTGCTQVDITATGPVTSRGGTGIVANSACGVRVTTLPGAPVQGATGGIEVTSGTGSIITIGDRVQAGNGLAIDVNGASTTLTNQATGTIIGRVDLTDAADTFNNAGTFRPVGTSGFGGGVDVLNNSGTIAVNPGGAAPAAVAFTGLETLNNSGLIDMRNGQVGDTLTTSGNFVGSGGSTLGVDVGTTTADRLIVGGAATGSTAVVAQGLNGGFVNGAVVVDAGAGTSAGAFTLANGGTVGIVDYSLVYDPGTNNFAVFGLPGQAAVSPLLMVDGGRQLSYRTNDAVGSHLDGTRTGKAFWMTAYGLTDQRKGSYATTAFGQPVRYSLNNRQDFFGIQAGVDLIGTETGTVLGVTGGYGSSQLNVDAGAGRARYDAYNIGVYGRAVAGPLRIEGLAKYEHVKARYGDVFAGLADRTRANGYGGYVKASAAFGTGRFTVAPFASLDYSHFNWKGLDLGVATADLDAADGMRGKAGARVETVLSDGPSTVRLYASGAYVHEFKGSDRMTLNGGGYSFAFRLPATPDYGQAKLGVAIDQGERVSGFIEAQGDFSGNYKGGGARAGLSLKF